VRIRSGKRREAQVTRAGRASGRIAARIATALASLLAVAVALAPAARAADAVLIEAAKKEGM